MNDSGKFAPGVKLVEAVSPAGFRSYPGKNLTPEKLASLLRELDQGYCRNAMELFGEMEEKDIHLATVMQTRITATASTSRRIVPASDSDEARKHCDFISEVWEGISGKTLAIHDILSSIGKGFSVTEMVFEVREGNLIVSELKFCPQTLFTFFDMKGGGKILEFPLYLPYGESEGEKLPRDKFIFHINRSAGSGLLQGGLYRGLAWYFLFTNYSIKDWMSFMDVYGIPLRLGKFKPSADESSRNILKKAVQDLGSDAAAIISEDTTIEFIESRLAGSHDLFQNAVEFFNRQKSKRVLGQTLTTEHGQSGSYSLGNVHDRVRMDILRFDCAMLDETLTRDFIVPLIKANFGEQKVYPRFVSDFENRESKTKKLDDLRKLFEMGLPLPVSQLYESAGILPPSSVEEVLRSENGKGAAR
ncbi:MAG: DUF935 domain-containing protein [Nitrospinota bacterium]|nr:DUF935 domain-containing protein [Nitrospinota bacterium]